jgi:hypothetical protein
MTHSPASVVVPYLRPFDFDRLAEMAQTPSVVVVEIEPVPMDPAETCTRDE